MTHNQNICGKSALITGASRGLGAAICKELLSQGIGTLFVTARNTPHFDVICMEFEEMASEGQTIIPIDADLSQESDVYSLLNTVKSHKKNIDILINNAGFTSPHTIFEAHLSELKETMHINVFAPFLIIQNLLQSRNKFKHIINIASTAGIKGRAGWATYSSSKAALIAMSEALREELLPLGTRVSCISPGRCATDLRKTLAPHEDPSTIMQPEDVARVISFLLSDDAHFIDSENLIVRK